ncbi:restriction endonuclease subunit S [Candidatus Borkfalkia ceftriaxoniphila]|uniref:Restriction endonuclease subunit S n=1 Tax=Candidatus Borkfalkia ceftriaxoniphila TaxID=2508949 RepID=A0A4Q2K853_9FIRM|nr:restriction endonuclease subunit S [Candidatus Borkfalkia ceftriaxoniphila]
MSKLEHNKHNFSKVPTLRFNEFTTNWQSTTLKNVCEYRKIRRTTEKKNYVSTENIMQNFQGVERFISAEYISGDGFNKNDILMGNIRPYLKKVCFADFDGVCNADVLVFNSKTINPKFLYYVLANDNFINYVMSSVKGSKMPRGDKNFIMQYPLSLPSETEQLKISDFIGCLTKRIQVQNKIIKHRKSLIFSLVIEILLSFLSLIESALSLNVFSFFNNLLKFMWTIFKEVKRLWSQKKT